MKFRELGGRIIAMLSNKERGTAFQLCCRDALAQLLNQEIEIETPIWIGGGKPHYFDLATRGRNIVAECKAFSFTRTGNTPSAKITTIREATMYLRSIQGKVARVLIVKRDAHPKSGETLGRYFVRLNANQLEGVTVLEMPEAGGELACLHGSMGWLTP